MKKSAFLSFISVLAVLLFGGCYTAFAQQNAQTTQYMFNPLSYNPGYAGFNDGIGLTAMYRQQWGGIYDMNDDGSKGKHVSPWDILILADAPIKAIKGALSFGLLSDNIGYFNDVKINLGYTYHLQTSIGLIGIGMQGVLLNKSINFSELKPLETGDRLLESKADESVFFGDISIGAYLQASKNYSVGVSISNIIPQTNEEIGYKIKCPLLSLCGDYTFVFPNLPKFELTATSMIQTNFSNVEWTIGGVGSFNKMFWAGVSYRLLDAVSVLAGVNVARFTVGVAYDISTSSVIKASAMGGSLEVLLKYCIAFDKEKAHTEYKNARYL